MTWRQFCLCALGTIFLILIPVGETIAQRPRADWAVTLYAGRLSDSKLLETAASKFRFEDAYFLNVGLSRRLYTYQNYFGIEIEGQVAKHFGDQDHWEFDLVGYFRWLPFPWDNYLYTSFAVGAGFSYAASIPETEAEHYDKTARLLGALMFEFAFSLPDVPSWSLITGIHHRSGARGAFSGVYGASNAWKIGLRYSF